jgi:hypothetical protein
VGFFVGFILGARVGGFVGFFVGFLLGLRVGKFVGFIVRAYDMNDHEEFEDFR